MSGRSDVPSPAGDEGREPDIVTFRARLDAMTAEQIEDALARHIYGPSDTWKARTAQNVLLARRQGERERREEDAERRRESSEVAALKKEIERLDAEVRARSQQLLITRLGLVVTALAVLAAQRESLWSLLKWSAALVTR